VRQNRAILAQRLGFDLEELAAAQQVHGSDIHRVSSEDAGRGAHNFESAIPATDALISNRSGIPLLILVADCAPILFVDERTHAFAVVHAGWRGAVAGIAGPNGEAHERGIWFAFVDDSRGDWAVFERGKIEVGEEVAAQIALVNEDSLRRQANWPKPHLDLRALIQRDLTRAGVLPQNIETSELCPKERGDLFFSHRGQNGVAGRFGIVAWWE
jgi:copper oxidase (laccase) domain-containing protein